MRTARPLASSMSDMRRTPFVVAEEPHAHLVEEAAVDLVDDLQVARQDALEQIASGQVSSASGSRV